MPANSKLKDAKCRTCLSASKGLKALAKLPNEKHQQISYGEMLKEVTRINVLDKKYEQMPQFICACCCRKLKTAHDFVKQAREVNEKLWSMLSENFSQQLDCLEETQIDLNIKQEIFHTEQPLKDKLQSELQLKLEDNGEQMLSNTIDTEATEETISFKNVCDTNNLNPELKLEETEVCNSTNIANIDNSKAIELKPIEIISMELKPVNDIGVFKSNIMSDSDDDAEELLSSDNSDWQDSKEHISRNNSKDDSDIAVPCEKCNKIFVNSKALGIHQRISHIPEEQKCSCAICGRKFTRYCNMYKHMRTFHGDDTVTLIRKPAEGDNLHECDKCSKKYARKKSLNTHMRRKHTDPQNKQQIDETAKSTEDNKKSSDKGSLCPICGSSFTSKTQLTVHIRRHTGERPFKCDLCDRAFLLATHLNCHKRLHTGEKPFKCKVCTKSFRVSTKLAQHMRSHSDLRPYKCSYCERSFKYSQDLNIHKRSHTGERPYVCGVCGSAFQRYNTLRDHRQRMGHTDDIIQLENELLNNLSS